MVHRGKFIAWNVHYMCSNQEIGESTTEPPQTNKKEKDAKIRREIYYNENEKALKNIF